MHFNELKHGVGGCQSIFCCDLVQNENNIHYADYKFEVLVKEVGSDVAFTKSLTKEMAMHLKPLNTPITVVAVFNVHKFFVQAI